MVKFARGLKLKISNRDKLKSFIDENARDPGIHRDSWGQNSPPKAIYIVSYEEDSDDSYYRCINEYVNGFVNTHYYDEEILNEIKETVAEEDGYDVEFVEEHK
jgi:hypothetical protein